MKELLKETHMLDFNDSRIQSLIENRGWKDLEQFECIKAIYLYVRDEILFGYNIDDSISASKVLSDGYGQCNTKGTLFMALLRACKIPCRVHGFTIDKQLQKGAMTGIVYKNAPQNVFHSWVEVYLDDTWYELEAFILDFQNPVIDFERNNTYIQSEGINQDFGIYNSPDELLTEHHQEMSIVKALAYRHFGRHLMNKNVKRIRDAKV